MIKDLRPRYVVSGPFCRLKKSLSVLFDGQTMMVSQFLNDFKHIFEIS